MKKVIFHIMSIFWIIITIFWMIITVFLGSTNTTEDIIVVNGILCAIYSMWYMCFRIIPLLFSNKFTLYIVTSRDKRDFTFVTLDKAQAQKAKKDQETVEEMSGGRPSISIKGYTFYNQEKMNPLNKPIL